MTVTDRYRYWRKHAPDMPASAALQWARYHAEQDALVAVLDWEWTGSYPASFVEADVPADALNLPDAYRYRVAVMADCGTEWGDIEPTDEEREHTSSYSVSLDALEPDGTEAFSDTIGGIDVADLPGYMQRDWEDGAAYALIEYLAPEIRARATDELAERGYWQARDVETA